MPFITLQQKLAEQIEKAFLEEGFTRQDPKVIRVMSKVLKISEELAHDSTFKFLDNLSVGIFIEENNQIIYANRYLTDLLGYTEAEFRQKEKFDLIHPDDIRGAKEATDAIDQGEVEFLEYTHRKIHKDGSIIWIRSQINGIKNDDGEVYRTMVSHIDVTSLIQSNQKNDDMQFIYMALLENATEGLEIIELNSLDSMDPNHQVLMRNEQMEQLFVDKSLKYLSATEFATIMPEIQQDGRKSSDVIKDNTEVLVEKKFFSGDIDFLINGKIRNCLYRLQLLDVNGKSILIRNYRDITDLKNKEKALGESEKKFRGFVESLPGAISIVNHLGMHEYISPQANKILGFAEDVDLTGTNVFDFFVKEDKKRIIRMMDRAFDDFSWDRIFKAIDSEGNSFPVEVHGRIIPADNADERKVITYFTDASEREDVRNEITLRKKIYETLIDNSFDAIDILEVDIDPQNGIINPKLIIRNEQMKGLLGDEGAMLSAHELREIIIYPDGEGFEQFYNKNIVPLIDNRYQINDFTIKTPKGEIKEIRGVLRLIDVNKKTFLVRILNDLTEEKEQAIIIQQQIEALRERQSELEKYIESNLQLENFAYIASHDLKAPLRTVLSFSQLIKRSSYDKLEPKDQEFLNIVIDSTNNMMLLIEDLLIFSRVNTKKVQPEYLKMSALIETISMDLSTEISQKGAEINWDVKSESIKADKVKIVQIIENLLRNAIKFVPKGRTPKVDFIQTENRNSYVFAVKDNGIGIKRDHYEKIFGIFNKLHSKDIYEGTGLGLSICSKIVEQHHGKIWVESIYGEGSTFYFTISKNIEIEAG
jgi:PAS domain S-box-containing protein